MREASPFDEVHHEERQRLRLSPNLKKIDGIGLALSGGGIRSASFALGVVQVMLNESVFRKFDYLSTVSGGGYLGSALSWWLHAAATDSNLKSTAEIPSAYSAFRQQLGSKVTGSRTHIGESMSLWRGSNWLAYIRQHGNYFQPRGVGYASLAASVLRVCLYPLLFVYGLALIGLFCSVIAIERWTDTSDILESVAVLLTIVFAVLLMVTSWVYGPATWFASSAGDKASRLYKLRSNFRTGSATLVSLMLATSLISSIPPLYNFVESHWKPWLAALSSLSLGSVGALYQFFKGRAQSKTPSWVAQFRLIATSALVIYGVLLATYAAANYLSACFEPWHLALGASLFSAFSGLCVNLNYVGLARLYRDRLMEAFLPDLQTVASNRWELALQANVQTVTDLSGRLTCYGELRRVKPAQCQRPLHLINCNVVLIDSGNDLFRNRGGDSFLISQVWSGSNATGWIKTQHLGDGKMTLATAMSISGAAANPNAAPNGLGVTRNRLVSFLMSIFNIRLGYWMANPRLAQNEPSNKPNMWFPGFKQGLFGQKLSEDASFLELTDGGHFDNTAIYELVRRRTKLIIVSQAGCDTDFTMADLANAIEKVRVDFSVFIEFDDHPDMSLDALRLATGKPTFKPCERGFAIGRIRYPIGTPTSPEFEDGWLVYLQAVPASLPADIASYWRRHLEFPNDTTADQFFSEENLEAYRELGYAIASSFYKELTLYSPHSAQRPAPSGRSSAMTEIAKLLVEED